MNVIHLLQNLLNLLKRNITLNTTWIYQVAAWLKFFNKVQGTGEITLVLKRLKFAYIFVYTISFYLFNSF